MMTRGEAIAILQEKYDCCKSFYDLAAHPEEDYPEMAKYLQALQIALTALRPVSREQVEKVWRGCNNCRTCDSCAYRYTKAEEEPCWSCNTNIYSNYKPEPNRKFCPACGAPMTDEAVDMVMERLEELHDTSN